MRRTVPLRQRRGMYPRVTFDRALPMALTTRPCRYPLPCAFCAENAALVLRASSMPHGHAAGGHFCSRCPYALLCPATDTAPRGAVRSASIAAALAPPKVKDFFNTTLQQNSGTKHLHSFYIPAYRKVQTVRRLYYEYMADLFQEQYNG